PTSTLLPYTTLFRSATRSANRYLKRIKYGNRSPNRNPATWQATDPAQLPNDTWMFELIFDYGEGHYTETASDAEGRVFAQAQVRSEEHTSELQSRGH